MSVANRLAFATSWALVCLAGPLAPAFASCAEANPIAQTARAEVIAYGTLTGIRMTFAPASPVVTFRPERVLKGTLTTSVEVFFGPTHGGPQTSVDYAGAPPEAHTLYLRRTDDSYETDACSGSHSGPPTADEERMLGRGAEVVATDAGTRPDPRLLVLAAAALAAGMTAIVAMRRRRRRAV